MLKFKNNGYVLIERILIILLVVFVLALISRHIQRMQESDRDEFDSNTVTREMIKQWKQQAELVIVGRLMNKSVQVNEDAMDEIAHGFYDISVESVERGQYSYDTITAYVGWISKASGGELYPPYVKKNYRTGDKVRIYLNYDPSGVGYYTPGALYTIEPL